MNLDPIALRLGPLEIRWYGLLMATAVAIGTYLAYNEAKRQKINPDHIINLVILAAPLGWIGARLYYVLFQWEYYSQHLAEIPQVWQGGLAIHGGILTGMLVGWLFARKYRLNFWQLADILAPSMILGQAIGRWGNFFNQEAYGYPTDLPWAMYIAGEFRHPTFLYESIWNLGVFLFLLWFRRRPGRVRGEVFLAYLGLYSMGRLWVEGLRTDSLMWGQFRAAQLASIALMIIALAVAFWRRAHEKKTTQKNAA